MSTNNMNDRRAAIDAIDAELLRLLNLRAQLAAELLSLKQETGQPICDPERELEVLQRAAAAANGTLDEQALVRIFRAVVSECRHVQERLARAGGQP